MLEMVVVSVIWLGSELLRMVRDRKTILSHPIELGMIIEVLVTLVLNVESKIVKLLQAIAAVSDVVLWFIVSESLMVLSHPNMLPLGIVYVGALWGMVLLL